MLGTSYEPESNSYMEEMGKRFVLESGSVMREVVRQEKVRRAAESGNGKEKGRKRSVSVNSKKSRRGSKKMGTIKEVVE